jgi:hypothetical protein
MSTGLTALQAAIGELNTKVVAIDADVKKLLANATSGPGPGQVIVNQADIDALTASVAAATTTLTADDTAVNPPPPAAGWWNSLARVGFAVQWMLVLWEIMITKLEWFVASFVSYATLGLVYMKEISSDLHKKARRNIKLGSISLEIVLNFREFQILEFLTSVSIGEPRRP